MTDVSVVAALARKAWVDEASLKSELRLVAPVLHRGRPRDAARPDQQDGVRTGRFELLGDHLRAGIGCRLVALGDVEHALLDHVDAELVEQGQDLVLQQRLVADRREDRDLAVEVAVLVERADHLLGHLRTRRRS